MNSDPVADTAPETVIEIDLKINELIHKLKVLREKYQEISAQRDQAVDPVPFDKLTLQMSQIERQITLNQNKLLALHKPEAQAAQKAGGVEITQAPEEVTVDPQLNELIHKMAAWRKQGVVATEHLNQHHKKLEENKDFQIWTKLHKEAKDKTTLIQAEVEKLAREIYDHTSNKSPHPAVNIKIFIEPFYKEEDAHAWCMDHLPKALDLNTRYFNKQARAVLETAPLDFVQFVPKLSVQIKSDLAEFIEDVNPKVGD